MRVIAGRGRNATADRPAKAKLDFTSNEGTSSVSPVEPRGCVLNGNERVRTKMETEENEWFETKEEWIIEEWTR